MLFLPALLFAVMPTLSATPTIAQSPTPSTTTSPTPTATIIPTPTPKPLGINFEAPKTVNASEKFEITLQLQNANPNNTYAIKILLGSDEENLYDGRTFDDKGNSHAWNASWNKMPTVTTDSEGLADGTIFAQTDDDVGAGDYVVVMRIRSLADGKNVDSEAKALKVTTSPSPTPTAVLPPTNTPTPTATPTATLITTTPAPTKATKPNLILVADAREKDEGTIVKIEGVVTSPPEQLGSRTMYVEDESGGIKILLDRKDRDDLKYEDKVEIIGIIGSAFNETYIKLEDGNDIKVIGQGDLPDPLKVPTGEVSEKNEGRLLQVNGQITATSGNTFYVNDGSGNVKVYVKDSTNIELPRKQTGDYSKVTGINSQYKEEYRLLPRFNKDIVLSTVPIMEEASQENMDTNAEERGGVLGASTRKSLPATAAGGVSDGWIVLTTAGLFLRKLLE